MRRIACIRRPPIITSSRKLADGPKQQGFPRWIASSCYVRYLLFLLVKPIAPFNNGPKEAYGKWGDKERPDGLQVDLGSAGGLVSPYDFRVLEGDFLEAAKAACSRSRLPFITAQLPSCDARHSWAFFWRHRVLCCRMGAPMRPRSF